MVWLSDYEYKHCEGIAQISVIKDTEKATEPKIEFCPFCGMSNSYPKEADEGWGNGQSELITS